MNDNSPRIVRTPPRRQILSRHTFSPTSDYMTQSTSSPTTSYSNTKDPQTLLLQRWHQISQDLSRRKLSQKAVIALNRSLDNAEHLLAWHAPETPTRAMSNNVGLGIVEDKAMVQRIEPSAPLTPPGSSSRLDAPGEVPPHRRQMNQVQQMQPLTDKITFLAGELQKRNQEFRHLHNVAIAKAEEAAEEILQLEATVDRQEEEIIDDESELTYLKLKLRILEIEAAPYIPLQEEESSLSEGIRKWKLDWAEVDNRFRMRRRKKDPAKRRARHRMSFENHDGLVSFPSPRND